MTRSVGEQKGDRQDGQEKQQRRENGRSQEAGGEGAWWKGQGQRPQGGPKGHEKLRQADPKVRLDDIELVAVSLCLRASVTRGGWRRPKPRRRGPPPPGRGP